MLCNVLLFNKMELISSTAFCNKPNCLLHILQTTIFAALKKIVNTF